MNVTTPVSPKICQFLKRLLQQKGTCCVGGAMIPRQTCMKKHSVCLTKVTFINRRASAVKHKVESISFHV